MLLLLIVPILVAGFVACHVHPVHSYRLHRYEGQYLYLKSAELGLKCFFIALVLALIGHYALPDSLTWADWHIDFALTRIAMNMLDTLGIDTSEATKTLWFFLLTILTFMSSLIIKAWGHISLRRRFGTWNTKIYVIGELLEDSPLDNLLFRLSLDKEKQIMLTLNDRKVYVGKVIDLGEPSATSGMDQDISIIPVMSGYRDKETLQVTFTTHYEDVATDLYISLRQDAIVSATEFDFSAYRQWNPAQGTARNPARHE